jgi:hypothetical protein
VATNVADITNFSDVYLGPASSDPATRNDSSALQEGDLYFNTVDDAIKVYTGSAWVTAYITADGFVTVADAQTITGVKTFDNGLATDTISEETAAAGVTVDGVLLKDNGVVTGAGTVSAPVYSTTDDTNTGIFFPAADTIAFAEGGAEAMRITSDGSLLIGGTTDTGQALGFATIQRTDAAPGLDLFRNDTSIADTDVLAQIRFLGNDTTSNTPAQLAYIRATSSGTHSAGDNPTDLVFATTPDGTASVAEAGRITQSGAYILKGGTLNPGGTGITFPATQSASSNANTLDDYEEGTWSPSDGSGAGLSITFNNATYTKIGRLVYIRCSTIVYPSTANGSQARVGNLPFTNASGDVGGSALVTSDGQAQRFLIVNGGVVIIFYENATDVSSTNAQLTGATIYGLSAVYTV